jgi:outer membrane protein OmpA-like peptidoglycan-associated protein
MNSRFIPLAAFALWSLLCWRWYVCGIKQQCAEKDTSIENAIQPGAQTAPATIDTSGQAAALNAIQAGDGSTASSANNATGQTGATAANSSKTSAQTTNSTQKSLTADISTAQVVAVEDHVLIHFPYGSNRRVDDDAIDAYLSGLANALVASGGKVTLIGHTDNIGDPAGNKAMSLDRAKHIRATLVKKGVAQNQVIVKGLGESKPIASNDNPRGRYKNRRVEVRLNK